MIAIPNNELLELWGNTLLQLAKFSKGSQIFLELFQNGCPQKCAGADSAAQQMGKWYQKAFGKEGIEALNTSLKEFYILAGVVPKVQYNALQDRCTALKAKVIELEEKIERLKLQMQPGRSASSEMMAAWTQTAQHYSEIQKTFVEEFGKLYDLKKEA